MGVGWAALPTNAQPNKGAFHAPRRAALLLLATIALAPALAASAPAASALARSLRSAPATPAAMNTTAPGLRLSEVLFYPAEGQPGFVELLNTGPTDATLDGLTLVNERDQSVALSRGLASLAVGAVLLVVFDGETRVEDSVLHAAPADFLTLETGAVALRGGADQSLLDAVAWGAGQPDAINLGRGGLSALPGELAPGTTIGRAPETTSLDRFDWTIFGPAEVTPGAPNPQPGVTVLLPLSGTILDSPLANLRWYPVPGATEYRVQLTAETDTDFAAPLVDATDPEPSLAVDLLPPGRYLWRVQAIGASDAPASFSPSQSLEVATVSTQGAAGVRALPASLAQGAQTNVLAVRPIAQHKDTKMLLIDHDVAAAGAHAWDGIHPGTDMDDPADRHNCVLAVAAIINAYKGGQLSQDRIGFEIRRNTSSGSEGDLNWNRNLLVGEADQALAFPWRLAGTHRRRCAGAGRARVFLRLGRQGDRCRPANGSPHSRSCARRRWLRYCPRWGTTSPLHRSHRGRAQHRPPGGVPALSLLPHPDAGERPVG